MTGDTWQGRHPAPLHCGGPVGPHPRARPHHGAIRAQTSPPPTGTERSERAHPEPCSHPHASPAPRTGGVGGWPYLCPFSLQVRHTTALHVGSIQAGSAAECGQCFSLSWMPSRPHQHLAAGFYDGEPLFSGSGSCPSCSKLWFWGGSPQQHASARRHGGRLEPADRVPAAARVPPRRLSPAVPIPVLPGPRPRRAEHRVVQSQQVRAWGCYWPAQC